MTGAWTEGDDRRLELARQGFADAAAARGFVAFARTKLEPAFVVEAGGAAEVAPADSLVALLDATAAATCAGLDERLELLRDCLQRGPERIRGRAAELLTTRLEHDDERRCEFLGGVLDECSPGYRVLFAESAGRWGLACLPAALAEFTPNPTWLRDIHRYVLAHPGEAAAHPALAALYGVSTWVDRRAMLEDVGQPAHAAFLPILVTLARTAEPTTQAAVVEAVGRIGHPGAEPLLLQLLATADPGLRARVVTGLRRVGTRAALGPLYQAARADGAGAKLARECEAIRAEIAAREGLGEQGGELGIAADYEGSLGLAQHEGGLALYEEVAATVSEAPPPPADARALRWSRIGLPPRRLSPWLRLTILLFGGGWGLAAWALVAVGALVHTPTVWLLVAIAGAFPLAMAVGVGRRDLGILRAGHATLAEPLGVEKSVKSERVRTGRTESTWWTYRFRFIGLDGADHRVEVRRPHERPDFADEAFERVLCVPTDGSYSLLLADDLSAVRLGDDGQWHPLAWVSWTTIPVALLALGLLLLRALG
jgi:hypothetical protein